MFFSLLKIYRRLFSFTYYDEAFLIRISRVATPNALPEETTTGYSNWTSLMYHTQDLITNTYKSLYNTPTSSHHMVEAE